MSSEPHPSVHVTGYPAQQPYTYHHYAPPPPNPIDPRATYLRRFTSVVIASFIFIFILIFLSWLLIRPRHPTFTVQALTATSLNTSNSLVSGLWNLGFSVSNPNRRFHIRYDRVQPSILYRDRLLSVTGIPPFEQATSDHTDLKASFASALSYNQFANELSADVARGSALFSVRILARVGFNYSIWRPQTRTLVVSCANLRLNFTRGVGNLEGGPVKCSVRLAGILWDT